MGSHYGWGAIKRKTEDGEWKREEWVIKIIEKLDPDEVKLTPLPLTGGKEIYSMAQVDKP